MNKLLYFPKYSDRYAWANSVDLYQMLQNVMSDQGLQCLPINISTAIFRPITGSQMDLFTFQDIYGKELRCPNIIMTEIDKLQ